MKKLKDIHSPPPIRVRDYKSAKRLLSRLIVGLQAGTVKGRDAKDLCYLLSVFMNLVRDCEIEKRVERIEDILEA